MKEKIVKLLESKKIDKKIAEDIAEAIESSIASIVNENLELKGKIEELVEYVEKELTVLKEDKLKEIADRDVQWIEKIKGLQKNIHEAIEEDVKSYKRKLARKTKAFINEHISDFKEIIEENIKKQNKNEALEELKTIAENLKPLLPNEESAKELDEVIAENKKVSKELEEARNKLNESKQDVEEALKEIKELKKQVKSLTEDVKVKEEEIKTLKEELETPLIDQIQESKVKEEPKNKSNDSQKIFFEMKRLAGDEI